jgi:hypothetical protein
MPFSHLPFFDLRVDGEDFSQLLLSEDNPDGHERDI